MNPFYVWLSVLIPDYEAIISSDLLSLGYGVMPSSSDGILVKQNGIFYRLEHPTKVKTVANVEQDIFDIIAKHKMHYHLIVVSEGFANYSWRPTNINLTKKPKKKAPELPATALNTPEVEAVMRDVKRILTPKGNGNKSAEL